jgi:predicted DNA-binding transcriptional regulator YafY
LAKRLEVSVRTIYRDLEALGAAGVPVYAEPGRNGGVRLLEGYRTDLSGLSLGEAELVPLLGLSDVFASVGVGPPMKRAEAKLLMSLPEEQRRRAEQSRRRIYVDLSRWWDHAQPVPHLPAVVEAVLAGRRLRIRYRRGEDGSVVRRTVDPFGLVVQGGTWYLVAQARKREVRTYRVSRIESVEALTEAPEIPDDFDLPAFWARNKHEFHLSRTGYPVKMRARLWVLRTLADRVVGETTPGADDDWSTAELSFEYRGRAFEQLLGMGPSVEVIEPEELRAAMSAAIERMQTLYVD